MGKNMTEKEKTLLADLIGFTGENIGDIEEVFDEYPDNSDFKFRYLGNVDDICVDITVDFDYTVRCSFTQLNNDDEDDDNSALVPDFKLGMEDQSLADWFERFKAGER